MGLFGGGNSSSTSNNTNVLTNTNTTTDRRWVADGGSIVGAEGSSVSVVQNFTDGGAVAAAIKAMTASNTAAAASAASVAGAGQAVAGIAAQLADVTVRQSLDVARQSLTTNATNTDHLFDLAEVLFKSQQDMQNANLNLTKSLAGTAQTAYADASAQASGNKNLILAALAVVGIAAVSVMGR